MFRCHNFPGREIDTQISHTTEQGKLSVHGANDQCFVSSVFYFLQVKMIKLFLKMSVENWCEKFKQWLVFVPTTPHSTIFHKIM